MMEDRIIDALSDIDEKFIIETDKLRSKKRQAFPVRKLSLIAACAALVFLCAFLIPILQRNTENSVKPPIGEGEILSSDTKNDTEMAEISTDSLPEDPETDESIGSYPPETENESDNLSGNEGQAGGDINGGSSNDEDFEADAPTGNSGNIEENAPTDNSGNSDKNPETPESEDFMMTVTVDEFTEDGFIHYLIFSSPDSGSVSQNRKSLHIICPFDISHLTEGSTVTVYYTYDINDPYTVYATHIEIEKGE